MKRLIALIFQLLPGGCLMWVCDPAWAATVTTVYEFSEEAREAQGDLLFASDGAIYGTAFEGGTHRKGTIFKWDPKTRECRVLHHFSDGRSPGAGLAETKDGDLLGTTSGGGSTDLGTIFKIDKAGAKMKILHTFSGMSTEGRLPYSSLRAGNGTAWFGTTDEGGTWKAGTVYRINEDGTQFRVIHHFARRYYNDGEKPRSPLCRGSDGRWYGTTAAGSHGPINDFGIVFSMDDDGRNYRIIHAFAGTPSDGAKPYGGLIEGADGKLYGTTVAGGRGLQGTLFRLNKDGSKYELLYSFAPGSNVGLNPYSRLVQAEDGKLYGVTCNGGAQSFGTVFRLNSDGSNYETLFAFSGQGKEGRRPYAGLSLSGDGKFYGVTTGGGSKGAGAIYCLETRAE